MDAESIRSVRSDHSAHQSRPLPRPPTLGSRDTDVTEANALQSPGGGSNHGGRRHRHRSREKNNGAPGRGAESEDGQSDVPSRRRVKSADRSAIQTAADSDVVRRGSEVMDDNWGETTTAVTGTSCSEAGFSTSMESMNRLNRQLEESIGFACARYVGTVVAGLVGIAAVVSPIVMVVLPKTGLIGTLTTNDDCKADCEGQLIAFAVKLVVLLIGSWALFFRHPRATMPRLSVFHALSVLLIFVVTVAFWLFYGVRIVSSSAPRRSYPEAVSFAGSMVDALLFVHYLAVILLELRQLQPYYVVKLVRSPDGASQSYTVGQLSVQHLAFHCLDRYYCDFQVYNPYLERMSSRRVSRTTDFKVYSVDGAASDTTAASSSVNNSRAGSRNHRSGVIEMMSLARGHNERFYDELDYERKVKKRKTRLVVAAEEAFTFIKRMQNDRGSAEALSPLKAAQNIFPRIARPLQKYLRTTRQQPRYTSDGIVNHLASCISHDLSAKAFIEPYVAQGAVIWNDKECGNDADARETHTWTIVSVKGLSVGISDGTVVKIQKGDVTLLATVRRLPHFNLTEDEFSGKNAKFSIQLNSETSV